MQKQETEEVSKALRKQGPGHTYTDAIQPCMLLTLLLT